MKNTDNQTTFYLKTLPLYDLHVTTKSYNVDELYNLGAKKVLFVNNAYAPEVHKPYKLTEEERKKYSADVSFIGSPEKERAESIMNIANEGIKVVIWGNGWAKFLLSHPNIVIKQGWFADEQYSKIICATKINLAFLRKVNRDLQTTRTMEIPACGGFILAERTEEHLNLFKEDTEAVFFSDDTELKMKIEYYLTNENERKMIAVNGLKRCKESGYDNITMVSNVIRYLI
jgi:spore maturation protein CgeB